MRRSYIKSLTISRGPAGTVNGSETCFPGLASEAFASEPCLPWKGGIVLFCAAMWQNL
jgi:hypothetical protein